MADDGNENCRAQNGNGKNQDFPAAIHVIHGSIYH
jgi:hypothetical protein